MPSPSPSPSPSHSPTIVTMSPSRSSSPRVHLGFTPQSSDADDSSAKAPSMFNFESESESESDNKSVSTDAEAIINDPNMSKEDAKHKYLREAYSSHGIYSSASLWRSPMLLSDEEVKQGFYEITEHNQKGISFNIITYKMVKLKRFEYLLNQFASNPPEFKRNIEFVKKFLTKKFFFEIIKKHIQDPKIILSEAEKVILRPQYAIVEEATQSLSNNDYEHMWNVTKRFKSYDQVRELYYSLSVPGEENVHFKSAGFMLGFDHLSKTINDTQMTVFNRDLMKFVKETSHNQLVLEFPKKFNRFLPELQTNVKPAPGPLFNTWRHAINAYDENKDWVFPHFSQGDIEKTELAYDNLFKSGFIENEDVFDEKEPLPKRPTTKMEKLDWDMRSEPELGPIYDQNKFENNPNYLINFAKPFRLINKHLVEFTTMANIKTYGFVLPPGGSTLIYKVIYPGNEGGLFKGKTFMLLQTDWRNPFTFKNLKPWLNDTYNYVYRPAILQSKETNPKLTKQTTIESFRIFYYNICLNSKINGTMHTFLKYKVLENLKKRKQKYRDLHHKELAGTVIDVMNFFSNYYDSDEVYKFIVNKKRKNSITFTRTKREKLWDLSIELKLDWETQMELDWENLPP